MRVTTVRVGPGAIIKLGDEAFCVKRWETSASVLGRNLRTLEDRVITLAEISESASKRQDAPQIDLSAIDDDEWDVAIEKYRLLSPLLHDPERKTDDVRAAGRVRVSPERFIWTMQRSLGEMRCAMRVKNTGWI